MSAGRKLRARAAGAGLLLVLAALGCESPSDPVGVRIQTGSAAYRLSDQIAFTATNQGGDPVYLARCCEVAVAYDRWEGGRWLGYSSGMCLAICRMDAIVLQAHGTYAGLAAMPDTGRYRLRIGVATSFSGLPDWSVTSNPFDVR
jgi:hypothetical protein